MKNLRNSQELINFQRSRVIKSWKIIETWGKFAETKKSQNIMETRMFWENPKMGKLHFVEFFKNIFFHFFLEVERDRYLNVWIYQTFTDVHLQIFRRIINSDFSKRMENFFFKTRKCERFFILTIQYY